MVTWIETRPKEIMSVPALQSGFVPPGRHPAELGEIYDTFVAAPEFSRSISRLAIWQNFERANELLQSLVLVHTAWIGGSFTSDRQNPRDIDVLYLVSGEDRGNRTPTERRMIETFTNRVKDPMTGRLVPEHGMPVDSFIVDWAPHLPIADGSLTAAHSHYAAERGYWEDWWCRRRSGSKKDPAQRSDAFPRRGYLEVQFGAYV